MSLAAVNVLGVVATPGLAPAGRVDRLAVDAGRGAGMIGLLGGPDLAPQRVVEPVQSSVLRQVSKSAPDGAFGGEVAGQVTPLAAGAEEIEHSVDDIPQVGLARPTTAGFGREVRHDQGPLDVGDVAGVMIRSHGITTTVGPRLFTLWDRL